MKKLLLLGTAISLAMVGVAAAADLPPAPPLAPTPYVKAPPPICIWCGFYVGANGGYAWGTDVGAITFTNSVAQVFTTTGTTFDAKGGFGGLQAGYNWQMGQIVLGVETDIEFASIKSDISGGVTGFADLYAGTRTLNDFGTVRGRLGFAFDRALLYATGGFAYGNLQDSISRTNALPGWIVSGSAQSGFVVGGGLEYMLAPAWSAKVEDQYIDLASHIFSGTYAGTAVTVQSNTLSDRFSTVRAGLNYKFNWH